MGLARLISMPLPVIGSNQNQDQDAIERAIIADAVGWFRVESGQEVYLPNYTFEEQAALVEALLWSFALFSLPSFLATYRVIWVEKEVTKSVAFGPPDDESEILFMSRPDAVVQDFATGEVAVISWKTIDSITDFRRRFYKHDLQGLMEIGFARQLIASEKERIKLRILSPLTVVETNLDAVIRIREQDIAAYRALPADIDYVQTIFLQKGKRKKKASADDSANGESGSSDNWGGIGDYEEEPYQSPESSVLWTQDSFLIYPWVRQGLDSKVPGNPFLSHKWRYRKATNVSYSTLGSSYKQELVPLCGAIEGVESWIRSLANNEIFPTPYEAENGQVIDHPLSKVVVWEAPSYRNEQMLTRVLQQVEMSEIDRTKRVEQISKYVQLNGYDARFEDLLDEKFPQRLISCSNPWRCQHQAICFDNAHAWGGLTANYTIRQPHHREEAEYFKSVGEEIYQIGPRIGTEGIGAIGAIGAEEKKEWK